MLFISSPNWIWELVHKSKLLNSKKKLVCVFELHCYVKSGLQFMYPFVLFLMLFQCSLGPVKHLSIKSLSFSLQHLQLIISSSFLHCSLSSDYCSTSFCSYIWNIFSNYIVSCKCYISLRYGFRGNTPYFFLFCPRILLVLLVVYHGGFLSTLLFH